MARKTVVELVDDLDGRRADETVRFSLDGVAYEIDLSEENAARLRKSLEPYVAQARRPAAGDGDRSAGSGDRRPEREKRSSEDRERSTEIRAWARRHGIQVNDRGRIPANVVEAYEANDPSKAKAVREVPRVEFVAP